MLNWVDYGDVIFQSKMEQNLDATLSEANIIEYDWCMNME
jgi:hypothetical protein